MVLVLSILAATCSIGGNILIAFKKKSGWLAWCIGNCLWIWESIIDFLNIPLIVMNAVYLIINLLAYQEWTKNKEVHKAIDKSSERRNLNEKSKGSSYTR